MICTAPAGNFVLSNGVLRERTELPERARSLALRARLSPPAYLVTLVAGPFVEIADRAPRTGVDVFYFVAARARGRRAPQLRPHARDDRLLLASASASPTPTRATARSPCPSSSSAAWRTPPPTTLTDLVLLDERAALDHDVDGLVSHELAHQWWGDLLTCREWSEAWLNEGFATYFEYVWREHAKGRDEADLELLVDADGYLAEAGRYQRPVVCRQYDEPIHLFDAHLYEKGGRVLHMLRHELGDAAFWRAHRATTPRKHAHGSVETRDLARAIEEATGRNVDELLRPLDRARPATPSWRARWEWDDDRKVGTLRLAQKQPITPEAPLFKFSTRCGSRSTASEQDERVTVARGDARLRVPPARRARRR